MRVVACEKWYIILFFIGISVSFFKTTTSECPPEVLIKPCKCHLNLVYCVEIYDMETLVSVFERSADRKFESFELANSSLHYLPASSISSKRFERVILENVTLLSMFDQSPDPSNNIGEIRIFNSRFLRGIAWEKFGNMKKLSTLVIKNTVIQSLGKSFVDNINEKIMFISVEDSRVRKLQYNAFSRLTDMFFLQLKNAEIKSLKRSLFPTPSKIQFFDFSNNQIDSLPDDLFTEMPKIESIDLSGNRISTIPVAVFGDVYYTAQEIKVENNPVVCDCSLRWIVSSYRGGKLTGNCEGPEDRKGKSFESLTPEDFSYCD